MDFGIEALRLHSGIYASNPDEFYPCPFDVIWDISNYPCPQWNCGSDSSEPVMGPVFTISVSGTVLIVGARDTGAILIFSFSSTSI